MEGLRLRRGEGDAQNDSQVDLEKQKHLGIRMKMATRKLFSEQQASDLDPFGMLPEGHNAHITFA